MSGNKPYSELRLLYLNGKNDPALTSISLILSSTLHIAYIIFSFRHQMTLQLNIGSYDPYLA